MQQQPRGNQTGRAEQSSAGMGTYMLDLLNAFEKGMAAEAAPFNLTPLEFNLLRICVEKGECTATQLAEVLPVDASRVSRLVAGLVDRRLLRRRRLRNDRRIVMLRVSEAGGELTSHLQLRMQTYYAKLAEGLSDREMRQFASSSLKIIANYEAMERT